MFKLTAYHHWLLKYSNGEKHRLIGMLKWEVIEEKNQQAFDLLEMTGDEKYTAETFEKAADLLINNSQPSNDAERD